MKSSNIFFFIVLITILVTFIQARKFRRASESSSESESESGSVSREGVRRNKKRSPGEIGRSIGNSASKNHSKKFKFYATPQPGWTESPSMFVNIDPDEVDEKDKDYFANYDFEFAKSGSNYPNFQQKLLKKQEKILEEQKSKADQSLPPKEDKEPGPQEEGSGAFAPNPNSKPTDWKGNGAQFARSIVGGLGL